MANLQSTNITGVLTVNGAAVGGGLNPKFQEFNASGTFAPSAALIAAGGYIEVFLVGGGGCAGVDTIGGAGGEVLFKTMYLTSTSGISVVIGASVSNTNGANGNSSSFNGSSAGGINITAAGGLANGRQENRLGAGFGAYYDGSPISTTAGTGTLGYGTGSAIFGIVGGVRTGKANSGQGSVRGLASGSGYCLVKWYQ